MPKETIADTSCWNNVGVFTAIFESQIQDDCSDAENRNLTLEEKSVSVNEFPKTLKNTLPVDASVVMPGLCTYSTADNEDESGFCKEDLILAKLTV